VIVALVDLDEAGFQRVVQDLKQAGLHVRSANAELGFVTGEAAPKDLESIKKVPGVDDAEFGRQVGILGAA
jgi:hypothetical protein